MSIHARIIIEGQTTDGKAFRPSDWAERIVDLLAVFGRDQRIKYSPLLLPVIRNGLRCVAIDSSLKNARPDIFGQVMSFAEANHLKIIDD